MTIISLCAKIQARKWIVEQYGKIIKIDRNCEYQMSFPLFIEKTNDKYNTELKQFIQRSFEQPGVLKVNNFRKKYKDYTSTLKNKSIEEQREEKEENQRV